jgi:hypothetical protein
VIDVNICGVREVGRLGRKPVLNVEALIGIHHVENQELRTSIETKQNPVRYVIITKPQRNCWKCRDIFKAKNSVKFDSHADGPIMYLYYLLSSG